MIHLKMQPNARLLLHAGGALAVFVLVYLFPPADMRSQPAENKGNPPASTFGSILTIEQYKNDLLEQHERYFQEKQKREEIEEKLARLEESYQEKLQLLQDAQKKLQQMAGILPKEQLAQAEEQLAQGKTELAEQLFDRVGEESGQTAAQALFQSGRLAEDRLDYTKAMRQYTKAVTLEEENPDYLLAAGRWLLRLLIITGHRSG